MNWNQPKTETATKTVTIYHDPFTKTNPEGPAEIVKLLQRFEGEPFSALYLVHFLGAEPSCQVHRIIAD